MKSMFAILATTALVGFATPGLAAPEGKAEVKSKVEYDRDGGYESTRTSKRNTSTGSEISETTVDVNVDSAGRVDKTIKAKATNDPKGLMNKKQEISETNIEERENGGYKQTTVRKHTDAQGTNITYKTTTEVDVDDDGTTTTSAVTEKTVDPKGLFNEKTSTSKTKSVNGRVVEQTSKAD